MASKIRDEVADWFLFRSLLSPVLTLGLFDNKVVSWKNPVGAGNSSMLLFWSSAVAINF